MSTTHINKEVIFYLEKSLHPARQKEIEEHLHSCKGCRDLVDKISAVYFSGDKQESPELNPFFYTRVNAKLERGQEPSWEIPIPVLRSLKPFAAGLSILTAITFTIFLSNYVLSSGKTLQPKTGEIGYESYWEQNQDPLLNLIVSNEN